LTDSAIVAIENESFGAPKNESKRETIKKMNRKIDAIVEDVKDLHEAGHGDWNVEFDFNEINFHYENVEDK